MGKRVKKKSRAPPKEKQVVAHSPKIVPQQCNPSVETVDDGVSVVKERKPCAHLDKGVDLNKLSAKIGSLEPIRCEDCREGVNDRRGSKGKGKQGKKKGSALGHSKSESKAIWVCLECGHYACGGVGLPTTPQSHVVRHVRQTHHPMVIQWENPHLRWCFPCKMLIPYEKTEENSVDKDVLLQVVKLIKGRLSEGSLVDVEDACFGAGSVTSEIKPERSVSSVLDGRDCYVVRGLVNLGNTCFFNSIMQNLLALDRIRDYFLKLDMSAGPLTIALKKLVNETKPDAGFKNVINPRSFFGCICSKAPQFRGYQQQDSHELLRCLLDGLSTEEVGARKQSNAYGKDGISSIQGPTFVDGVFGGQISSTVCCVECGHSSTVYEPFLDLSLPVPTKKPPSKKPQPVSRAKKAKLPPKKGGRIRPKVNKGADTIPAQSISSPSASSEIPGPGQLTVPFTEKVVASSGDHALSGSVGPITETEESVSVSKDFSAVLEPENETQQTAALVDDSTWLDYLEPGAISDENDLTSQNNVILSIQDSGNIDIVLNDVLMKNSQACSEPNVELNSSVNNWDEEIPLQVQDSEVFLLPYKEETSTVGEIMRGEDEASSSVLGYGQDELDFDGIGDLFNEPEIVEGPVAGPSLRNEAAETGFIVGNSSDSDPDEVDNSDSPVSLESCLAYFIKPELLSNDNAWDCENCSKSLRHQRLETKKQVKIALKTIMNGGETQKQSDPLSFDKDISCRSEVRNLSNGDTSNDIALTTFGDILVSRSQKIECSNQNSINSEDAQVGVLNPVVSKCEERKGEMENAFIEHSHSSGCYKTCSQQSFNDQASDSCSVGDPSGIGHADDKAQHSDSQLSAGNHESEETKDEELNTKSVKLKRDATKRVLINKAPSILTIHLKRFSQDARGRLSKLNGHVNFRETIDLSPYMDPRLVDREKYVYRLLGVVEHLGTMRGGHYVAYVRGGCEKNKGKEEKENERYVWYHASDAYVRQVSLEEVLRCEAYILFYEKI